MSVSNDGRDEPFTTAPGGVPFPEGFDAAANIYEQAQAWHETAERVRIERDRYERLLRDALSHLEGSHDEARVLAQNIRSVLDLCPARSPEGEWCKYKKGHDVDGQPHSWTRYGIGGFV